MTRLSAGAQLGPYAIETPLGAGGMGEVYRARDTRLDRTVAIKILPDHLSGSPDLKARFEREAKAISSLSHPHICTLFDVGSDDGVDYMVLELLEGETLSHRLARGPLPMGEVPRVGAQIAEALHAAHRKGVLHRDLKPGNIILTENGVKVLDFGLAKVEAMDSRSSMQSMATAPISEDPVTAEGTVMGTPRYMAPEVLEGRGGDVRSDVFALGAVLYEMATGTPAFEGDTHASIVGSIMKGEPVPVSERIPLSPVGFDRLVGNCLVKDPEKRMQSAYDVALELDWLVEAPDTGAGSRGGKRALWWVLLVVGGLAFLLGGLWGRSREQSLPAAPVRIDAAIPLAEGTRLGGWGSPVLTISPDGSRLAWVANDESGSSHAYVRDLGSHEIVRIPDSEEAEGPFFSPDGNWVGFAVGTSARSGRTGELLKYSVERGITQSICPVGDWFGGAWGEDGMIVFSGVQPGGLRRVSASGGVSTPLALKDSGGNVMNPILLFPELLPGGNLLASLITSGKEGYQAVLVDPEALEMKSLGIPSVFSRYSPSGHILTCSLDATVFAVPFDPSAGAVTGSPVAVMDNIALTGNGGGVLALSRNGTLVHATGYVRGSRRELSEIIRIGPSGEQTVLPFPPTTYTRSPAVSDDGRLLAVGLWDERIQVLDLRRKVLFSVFGSDNSASYPVWLPGENEFVWVSYRVGEGRTGFYRVSADGSTPPELILEDAFEIAPGNFTPGGDTLIFERFGFDEAKYGVFLLPLDTRKPVPMFEENTLLSPRLSPDGRWLAYSSGETGPNEVYVRSFPDSRNRRPVSVGGGVTPRWSADGRTLYYRSGNRVLGASVGLDRDPEFGSPVEVFEIDGLQGYDPAPDGSIYVIRTLPGSGIHTEVSVTTGWLDELRKLMGGES